MLYPRTKLDLEIEGQKKRGILVVVSGPSSGVGKDSVVNGFREKHQFSKIITYTSRPKRPHEKEGFDYHFVSPQDFQNKINQGFFLEWMKYLDNFYGTPKKEVQEALKIGKDILLRVDVRGAKAVKKAIPQAVLIYIAAPSFKSMAKRLESRKSNSPQENERKLQVAVWEVEQFEGFDYLVVNEENKLQETIEKVRLIVEAERLRVANQRK